MAFNGGTLSPELYFFLRVLAVLYAVITLWMALYGLHSWTLLTLYWWHRRRSLALPDIPPDQWPVVTVQLPIYNERHVVRRLIDAAANLDYPRDRLEIQVLDDSTDETTRIAEARAAFWRDRGINVRILHRSDRTGYKAGALAWGLQQAQGEFIAIFDADFRPQPDFLRRTVPYFLADSRLGMVQTRWSHLNAEYSFLTRAEALALDGHFMVEQTARSRAGLLMHFNGTGGIWRRACIEESGGWQSDTVCEDLDLSYRAQLRGWRALFLPDVESPGELPPQMLAFKQQQARWAQGSVQSLRKLALPILQNRSIGTAQKIAGLLHLSGYFIHPLLVLLLLLTLPTLAVPHPLQRVSGFLGLICLGPILVYVTAQQALYRDWPRRLLAFPLLTLVGTGIAWNNTRAIWQGLIRWGGTFSRTPKFHLEGQRGVWKTSCYRLREDHSVVGEIILALYALGTAVVAWESGRAGVVPFMLLCAASFGLVAGTSLYEMRGQVVRIPRRSGKARRGLRLSQGGGPR